MAGLNLGYSDATWTRFDREESFFVRVARWLEDMRRRCVLEREQLENIKDFNSNFDVPHSANDLTGFEYGTNTDEKGEVCVRITGTGPYTVKLYKAAGGGAGDEIASGSAAAGATVTLTASNSSGVSGTLRLAATVTAEADDVHRIRVLQDWKKELLHLWPSDGTTDEDTESRKAAERMLQAIAVSLESAIASTLAGAAEWGISGPNNPVARGNRFLKSSETSLWSEGFKRDSSGNVTRPVTGLLQRQKLSMAAETTGSTQDIIKRIVEAAAGSFASDNDGQGTVAAHTPSQRCPVGRWTFRCVKGIGTGDGGREEFAGEFVSDTSDLTFAFDRVRIGQSWKGPRGFGPIVPTRTYTKSGDASNLEVGAASTFTTAGELESNTDGGVLYGKTVANGSNWDIEFYKSANRASGDLMAKATNVATGAISVQASAQNGSSLSLTFDVGSGPTDGNTWSIDCNFFSVQNNSEVPDSFTIDTTLTSTGKAARVLAEVFGAELNGDTSGSESVDDDMMATAGTGLDFMQENI